MAADPSQQIIEAGWDTPPRWLRYTGLPQVLGQTPMDVLDLLLRRVLSYRSRERPAATREGQLYPPDTVPFTRGELARQVGVSEKTVKRAIPVLVAHNVVRTLSDGYRAPGGPAVPSWVCVDTKLLGRTYVLSCSEVPRHEGGLERRGETDELMSMQLFLGEKPIRILRANASCCGWSEPPVALIEALCKNPDRFEELLATRQAAVNLEVACRDLLELRDKGQPVAVDDIRERWEALEWAPAEVESVVENLLKTSA